ncbi:hypothetical protein PTSG_11204 [Salpingoeca rosetta]|uniref:Inositol-pentakisphosphate 2-kinase n=1 Tax=Salpingoeca rosetta (strain ATCC 50818 / BSB-021) TaxID=946362 RepID=F2USQ5_SALR5|nr:uncharacterized protein PTSG_11204 [Salpingoeca rosetta]EGD81164.1 hypothetical protein PTSG_11204 [Salpingoeca rosetta]|eukprot:XP_004987849.1 hypothetical protein PTSG_11204 [Salpingoeca rosetta]
MTEAASVHCLAAGLAPLLQEVLSTSGVLSWLRTQHGAHHAQPAVTRSLASSKSPPRLRPSSTSTPTSTSSTTSASTSSLSWCPVDRSFAAVAAADAARTATRGVITQDDVNTWREHTLASSSGGGGDGDRGREGMKKEEEEGAKASVDGGKRAHELSDDDGEQVTKVAKQQQHDDDGDGEEAMVSPAWLMLDHLRAAAFKDCSVLVSFCSPLEPTHDTESRACARAGAMAGSYRVADGAVLAKLVIVDLDFKGTHKIAAHKQLFDALTNLQAPATAHT